MWFPEIYLNVYISKALKACTARDILILCMGSYPRKQGIMNMHKYLIAG